MSNIKDIFVSYQIAKQLKEKGFDEECFGYYNDDRQFCFIKISAGIFDQSGIKNEDCHRLNIIVPTHQQVLDWLRENGIVISIYNNASGYLWNMAKTIGGTEIRDSNYDGPNDSGCWDTYYEALNTAILTAITLIP